MVRAEPTKQKTRRPERRGIARAVSPKKIGRRKKANVEAREHPRRRRNTLAAERRCSNCANVVTQESADYQSEMTPPAATLG